MKKIKYLIEKALEEENITLSPSDIISEIEGWDSLTSMVLVDLIENEYNIDLEINEIEDMTVNQLNDLLDK